jgi:hypothetical protein
MVIIIQFSEDFYYHGSSEFYISLILFMCVVLPVEWTLFSFTVLFFSIKTMRSQGKTY